MTDDLRHTVLHDLHRRHGARFGPFAGWDMPIRYATGPVAEHEQCRRSAALFDVSHMTIVDITGDGVLDAMERLVPADLHALAPSAIKYSFFTNAAGGILDDVMITNRAPGQAAAPTPDHVPGQRGAPTPDHVPGQRGAPTPDHVPGQRGAPTPRRGGAALRLVLNAATTEADLELLRGALPKPITVTPRRDLAIVALQGPQAESTLSRFDPGVRTLTFMHEGTATLAGHAVELSRSGYTGGDGFELALPAEHADELVELLLAQPEVGLSGLAARDSLRLEAGVCLYGQDLDPTTTPVEAGLQWAIPKSRRVAGAGYPGAAVIARQFDEGPPRRRVGLRPVGRRPVREGAELRAGDQAVGVITSGGYSPVLGAPIAMGYVDAAVAADTPLAAVTGGRAEAVRIVPLPFVTKDYHR